MRTAEAKSAGSVQGGGTNTLYMPLNNSGSVRQPGYGRRQSGLRDYYGEAVGRDELASPTVAGCAALEGRATERWDSLRSARPTE